MMSRTNVVLAVLLAAVVAATVMVRVDHTRPNYEFLPDMKYSPAWGAYEAGPIFPNGRTLQAPQPGTIARGRIPLHYAPTKEDAERAGRELLNPLTVPQTAVTTTAAAAARQQSADSQRRGAETFRTFCTPCHGAGGAGDGAVAQRGFPPPPSLLTGKSLQMKDGQLFHILSYGQGAMPPLADQLDAARRWDAINFVRELQTKAAQSAAVTPAAAPPAGKPSPPAAAPPAATPAENEAAKPAAPQPAEKSPAGKPSPPAASAQP